MPMSVVTPVNAPTTANPTVQVQQPSSTGQSATLARQRQARAKRGQDDLYNEYLQQLADAYTNDRQRITFFDLLPDPLTLGAILVIMLLALRFFNRE